MGILDSFKLDSRTVIVTGASSGLGVAFAQACAEAGAHIVLAARRLHQLDRVASDLRAQGFNVFTHQTNVTEPEQCVDLVDSAMEEFGRVDVLVNNAGIGTIHPAINETPSQFREVIDTNLNGSYWLAQACARVMESGSSIINISSVLGLTTAGMPHAAYSASKAGLLGLTRDLAQQWGTRRGIRVNAVAPGFFLTEMTQDYPVGYLDTQADKTLLGRLGDARELATTVVWLASEAASYITGQTIIVDGGFTIA